MLKMTNIRHANKHPISPRNPATVSKNRLLLLCIASLNPPQAAPGYQRTDVYKKAANRAPQRPRPRLVWRRPAPLSGLPVDSAPPAVESDVELASELASSEGLDEESSDDPDVGDDPDVCVRVPARTVPLPLEPEPEEPVPTAPPVGPAAPPPTTEDTRVVPLMGAGTP